MQKTAIYPGTFDPVTLGHMDVIKTASGLFDKVYVAMMINPKKTPVFSIRERTEMIKLAVHELGISGIEIVSSEGLTVEFAKKIGADFILRGIRLTTDYEEELFLCFNNQVLDSGISTLFIPPKQEHVHISSTAVRVLLDQRAGNLKSYLPKTVFEYLERKKNEKVS